MLRIPIAISAFFFAGAVGAQDLPDYPRFRLTGLAGSNPAIFNSDLSGIAIAKVPGNDFASFHTLTLTSLWDPEKLRFEYSCVYSRAPDSKLVETPTYSDGETCPPNGNSGNSHFVRAIRITLAGTEASKYALTSRCWLGFLNQRGHETLGPVGSGDWCGRQNGGADKEWISWIEVRLHRK